MVLISCESLFLVLIQMASLSVFQNFAGGLLLNLKEIKMKHKEMKEEN